MPVDFSMTNRRFPMSSGGNRLLCLYEVVSGRNVGFSRGGGRWGEYDDSHSAQIYGQDRGAPLDARRGDGELRPFSPGLPKQMLIRTTWSSSLHPPLPAVTTAPSETDPGRRRASPQRRLHFRRLRFARWTQRRSKLRGWFSLW